MLVLQRGTKQRVFLRCQKTNRVLATVTLVKVLKNSAKLGFEAGPEINIVREELTQPPEVTQ